MGTKEVRATRYESGTARALGERLPLEAPLQIQVNGEDYAATLRTPGADRALVRGLLCVNCGLASFALRCVFVRAAPSK